MRNKIQICPRDKSFLDIWRRLAAHYYNAIAFTIVCIVSFSWTSWSFAAPRNLAQLFDTKISYDGKSTIYCQISQNSMRIGYLKRGKFVAISKNSIKEQKFSYTNESTSTTGMPSPDSSSLRANFRIAKKECISYMKSPGTCRNGLKDSDEEGIDCGGSCKKRCAILSSPTPTPILTSTPTATASPSATATLTPTATPLMPTSTPTTPPFTGNPVLNFQFDETSGSTATDSSGRGNHGAVIGSATWGAGQIGGAIQLAGSGHVSVQNATTLGLGAQGSISAWVKVATLNTWHSVLSKGAQIGEQHQNYALEINPQNVFECQLGDGLSFILLKSSRPIVANRFYHVLCSWTGSLVNLYVDGQIVASAAQTITPRINTAPLQIGAYSTGVDLLRGSLDEVKIFSSALNDAQVIAIANQPATIVIDGASVNVSGRQGGPFAPSSVAYRVTNVGVAPVAFRLSGLPSWLIVTTPLGYTVGTSSQLASGSSLDFVFDVHANSLPSGNYTANLLFENLTNGNGNAARTINLIITALTQCNDGVDNDGDGATDLLDFSCLSTSHDDETNPRSQCQDGIDNDNDQMIDENDQDCLDNQDNYEASGLVFSPSTANLPPLTARGSGPGSTLPTISNYNSVPDQVITKKTNIGVVAFHPGNPQIINVAEEPGIERVDFYIHKSPSGPYGPAFPVTAPSENPATCTDRWQELQLPRACVIEYHAPLDPGTLGHTGVAYITYIAIPKIGIPVARTMRMNLDPGNTLAQSKTRYVSSNGNDSNTCSLSTSPCRTIAGAISKLGGSGDGAIIHVGPGTFAADTSGVSSSNAWLTIRGSGRTGPGQTIIDSISSRTTRVKYENLLLLRGHNPWGVTANPNRVWYHEVDMRGSSRGDQTSWCGPIHNGSQWVLVGYATNSSITNSLDAYRSCALVRSSNAYGLGSNFFSDSLTVINTHAHDISLSWYTGPAAEAPHPDVYHSYSTNQNIIIYGMDAVDRLNQARGIAGSVGWTNSAVVDARISASGVETLRVASNVNNLYIKNSAFLNGSWIGPRCWDGMCSAMQNFVIESTSFSETSGCPSIDSGLYPTFRGGTCLGIPQ